AQYEGMNAMRARCMARTALSEGARVLELGCGNPSSAFIDMAGKAFAGEPRVSFATGDATATGQADGCFDLVIAHTVYSNLVEPEWALGEAHRVLRPGWQLAALPGDFAPLTGALFDDDPLQVVAGMVLRNLVHAPYVMRRLPALVAAAGFSVQSVEPHGYVQTSSPDYLLTLLSRGTHAAVQAGKISEELVGGFNQEAR